MTYMLSLALCLWALLSSCTSDGKQVPETSYPVALGEATEENVPIFVEAIGTVVSQQSVEIRPQVTGILVEAYVKEGSYVKKGDPLYQIDPRPYQAALDRAESALLKDRAALEYAKITLERYKEVANKDYISKLNYEQYQANVESAQGQVLSDQADIELAKLNLEWCTVTSPVSGRISENIFDMGNLVVANDPNFITDVRQIDPIEIIFNIPQRDFVRVQQAQKAETLKFQAILPQADTRPRDGNIFFVDNHIDTNNGTIMLKGLAENSDEFLWPGEYVRVRLQLKIQENAILVPEEAVQIGQDGAFVYVYKPDTSTAEYRKVVKGEKIDHKILIESGVVKGDQVVTRGTINLRPGSKVHESVTSNKKTSLAWEEL